MNYIELRVQFANDQFHKIFGWLISHPITFWLAGVVFIYL